MIYPLHTEWPTTSFLVWLFGLQLGFFSVMMAFPESVFLWVAAGVLALAGIIYAGWSLSQYTPILNRDRMATRHRVSEFQSCVACGKTFKDGEDGSAFHLMKNYDHLGTASVHHRHDCLVTGSGRLDEQISESNAAFLRVVHRTGGKTFLYDMIVDGGFGLELAYDKPANQWTVGFLRQYIDNDGIVLVKFGGTDERGESGREYDRIPMLLPVTSSIVKVAVAEDENYVKRRAAAKTKMRRDMTVRDNKDQRRVIMSQYARDTALTAKDSMVPTEKLAVGPRL